MTADTAQPSRRHRPKAATVFVAAFIAGAVAAVVVNRMLDLHLAQAKPQVESEPIFVSLRPLPQGSPVTVWDVALRDWPRAMLPSTALRARDSFAGSILKYPLREGQPLLSVHLLPAAATAAAATEEAFVTPSAAPPAPSRREPEPDLWTPGGTAAKPSVQREAAPREIVSFAVVPLEEPANEEQPVAELAVEPITETLAETLPNAQPDTTADPVADLAVAAETSVARAEEQAAEPAPAEPLAGVGVTEDVAMDDTPPAVQPTEEPPEQAVAVGVPTLVAVEPRAAEPPAPEIEERVQVGGPAVSQPAAPIAATLTRPGSDLPLNGRFAPEPDAAADMLPQAAIDLDSLPSVMARSGVESQPDDAPPAAGNLRYLVVPERIARQADTMFAPPVAAEPKAAVEQNATAKPSEQARPQHRPQPSQSRPQAGQPPHAQTRSTAAPPRASKPQAQAAPGQRTGQRPAANVRPQPVVPAGKEPPRSVVGQPAREDDRSPLGPRAWGGMFPNVAAGIEAMGNRWRGEDRAAAEPQPAPQQRR